MKAIKKEFQERRAKEHAERKIARETHVLLVERKISIFEQIMNHVRRLLS
jgi:hypothetical protein